jgi:hypothetical protein
MRLWLLQRTDRDAGWDEYLGFVIAAHTRDRAREMAKEHSSESWWLDPSQTSIEDIGEAAFPEDRMVLDSFKAG